MLISHRKKFIYTKTVKTAGTSVESYFEKYCMPEGEWEFSHAREMHNSHAGVIGYRGFSPEGKEWFNHMSLKSIKARLDAETWERYFKFCVVRNPYDKLVSAFYFFFLPKMPKGQVRYIVDEFRSWVSSGRAETIIDRDKYLIDGEICVDDFVRYECMYAGIESVCNRLGIPYKVEDIPRLKVSDRPPEIGLVDYYDQKTTRIVEKLFDFELSYFGYRLD